ncbi:DUF2752 domain-containing protein [Novipirellula artificiosorum]|uniref:DUF2752 domain-containing protein n=1 Tax=Novipirellula artificiosorum TaxID=2528016 RepID=A0A5C6DQV0_9BACT|nr:DUF2752 domain-containing protein [Novipirellula artificiosorum]TWU38247.1 hypothetical protein Poly41_27230 [Novipirellula artificiosorum]
MSTRANDLLRWLAYVSLAFYLGWNLWEIMVGHRVPRSIFFAATGMPCPTTGGTRSMLALLQGDLALALHFNPFAIPITALAVISIIHLVVCRLRPPHPFRLPNLYLPLWLTLLGIAWVYQLAWYPR